MESQTPEVALDVAILHSARASAVASSSSGAHMQAASSCSAVPQAVASSSAITPHVPLVSAAQPSPPPLAAPLDSPPASPQPAPSTPLVPSTACPEVKRRRHTGKTPPSNADDAFCGHEHCRGGIGVVYQRRNLRPWMGSRVCRACYARLRRTSVHGPNQTL